MRWLSRLRSWSFTALVAFLALTFLAAEVDAARYYIRVVKATITPKKTRFRRWDAGFGRMTKPDVYVVIDVAGQRFVTSVVRNTIYPTWNQGHIFNLDGNEKVYITVIDKDKFSDDTIGRTNVFLTTLSSGSLSFGKVVSLTITVARLDVPKPRPVHPTPVQPTPAVKPQPRPVQPTPAVKPQPRPVQPTPAVKPQPHPVQPTPAVKPQPRPVKPAPAVKPQPRPVKPAPFSKKVFCLSLMRHSLKCLKLKYQALKQTNNPKQQAFLGFFKMLITKLTKQLNAKDKTKLLANCDKSLKKERLNPTPECLKCLIGVGCTNRRKAKATCRKVCLLPTQPRPVQPAPTKPQPRPVQPAPTKPQPRPVQPAPTKPQPRPVQLTNAMLPKEFCSLVVKQAANCLKKRLLMFKQDPQKRAAYRYLKLLVTKYEKGIPQRITRCVQQFKKKQEQLKAQNKTPMTNQELYTCWMCLKKAQCASSSRRHCQKYCVK